MKPLLAKDINSFLKRFGDFCNSEFRDIKIVSPSTISVTLATQDEARAFDWVSITLEFNGVSDAMLLDNSKLNLVDMSDGVSIINENNLFYFGIGKYSSLSSMQTSICQIVSSSLKYQEGSF